MDSQDKFNHDLLHCVASWKAESDACYDKWWKMITDLMDKKYLEDTDEHFRKH